MSLCSGKINSCFFFCFRVFFVMCMLEWDWVNKDFSWFGEFWVFGHDVIDREVYLACVARRGRWRRRSGLNACSIFWLGLDYYFISSFSNNNIIRYNISNKCRSLRAFSSVLLLLLCNRGAVLIYAYKYYTVLCAFTRRVANETTNDYERRIIRMLLLLFYA